MLMQVTWQRPLRGSNSTTSVVTNILVVGSLEKLFDPGDCHVDLDPVPSRGIRDVSIACTVLVEPVMDGVIGALSRPQKVMDLLCGKVLAVVSMLRVRDC